MESAPSAAVAGEDLRRAAATPIEVDADVDDLRNAPSAPGNVDSPTKRTRWDIQGPAATAPALALEQRTAQLATALAPITGGLQDMQKRVANIEEEVTTTVGSALELIRTLDHRQKGMSEQVDGIREQVTAQAKAARKQEQDIRWQIQRTSQRAGPEKVRRTQRYRRSLKGLMFLRTGSLEPNLGNTTCSKGSRERGPDRRQW